MNDAVEPAINHPIFLNHLRQSSRLCLHSHHKKTPMPTATMNPRLWVKKAVRPHKNPAVTIRAAVRRSISTAKVAAAVSALNQ